jgi:erythronate-4-phosphate dehydrogenase
VWNEIIQPVKIVADENIPQIATAFAALGQVELLPGRQITRDQLRDCQCLLVRTVTSIDRNLLQDTPVEFIGSATIGTDHVDLSYLNQQGIAFSNAAGCNAEAAAEYVISGLFALSQRKGFDPFSRRAGIIGCGNVGSKLKGKLQALGIETLICDPPKAELDQTDTPYVNLETIISECDLISLHVPLTQEGKYPTHHLFNYQRLSKLRKGCLLVNAARGPVVDNLALEQVILERPDLITFLDTWENEPNPSRTLLEKVDLATPHIAGYSVEGRLWGTQMILDAANEYFGQKSSWRYGSSLPESIQLKPIATDSKLDYFQQLFEQHHPIWQDHLALTNSAHFSSSEFTSHFDSLRRVYPERFEYERYRIDGEDHDKFVAMTRELLFR